jgi:hypothetical protein
MIDAVVHDYTLPCSFLAFLPLSITCIPARSANMAISTCACCLLLLSLHSQGYLAPAMVNYLSLLS